MKKNQNHLVVSPSEVEHSLFGANAAPIRQDPGRGGEMETDVIYGANEGRFESASFEAGLTEFTVGWKDPANLDVLLEYIAPQVMVPDRRFEFKKNVNVEQFQADNTYGDDVRAIGQDFKRVEYSRVTQLGKTLNKGLMVRVDHDDVLDDSFREIYTARLLARLHRNDLIRGYVALLAAAINTGKTWYQTGATLSNPDADVRNAIIAAGNDSGIEPNRCVFGRTAWASRQGAYENANVFGGGFSESAKTPEQVAAKLMLDSIMVFSARYQSSASAKSLIAALTVVVFSGQPGASKDDPTTLKTFRTSTEGGTPFRVYVKEEAKHTDIMVEHYSDVELCDSQGCQKLTITNG